MNHCKRFLPVSAALLSLMLAGCGSSNRDFAGRLLVAPGRYLNYDCQQLENRVKGVMSRRKQLEELMAKAETSFDGRLISGAAYRTEYAETSGDLDELRAEAAAKECKPIAALPPQNTR